ncbi:hypothetical protein ACC713_13595 [Rhizobium johnstonii]|uniref:Uncharacterized protein n=1 Tax=Rhizobium johnstonii (strain DSM 114642 / LMG 32736 / 3841) TaxID=216596 RepID=Q1MHP0_RHIJ3|nr:MULTISPECIES: hypothetical protein [Rhizobium]MBB4507452.1 hypothetical protein [Rhizobium leguminosarum]MBY5321836.1 hypothetical protein [Rhizobium leguminosarum]MBY5343746.1 hypothetical protein [Rhizobium leguminosarum]MBY5374303.1 hypothetical protein [Rhizobium leguminosarum]MBY5385135.1 hypothetical protein [Rhizobium leguminosarum]
MNIINHAGMSSAAAIASPDEEVIQLLYVTAKEVDLCCLMTDGEWEDYDKTVVNRACDLGLVTIHSPGGGWSYVTGWRLTKLGKETIGIPAKLGILSRLLALTRFER